MASRKDQKEAARQRRLAEEQQRAEKARRTRRLQMLGGMLVGVIVVLVAAIAISSGGGSPTKPVAPNSQKAKTTAATVTALLKGIPESGNRLGSPSAPVTLTEYGDLVCPICQEFALGSEAQIISNDVRAGKVKIVYRALETASGTANNSMFVPGQVAALAAGQQDLGWYYIELFYHEQQSEDDPYVTNDFLDGLAAQVPGLNFTKWNNARSSSSLAAQVRADEQAAANQSFDSTPTIVISGPKGQAQPIIGNPSSYSQVESVIKSVSS